MAALKKEKPIIEVKNLSKQYSIGTDTTYKTLSESFTSAVRHPLKTLKDCRRQNDTFCALKDVNFEVERGEVLGIIGRNGAGKSTLLKILSRITYPTGGEVRMHGRVGSLLEVGTGFHPELSGRENIYFNGSILGMKKREIDEKFDEIVKFSGIEKFLDTPVKRYSSGMNVRLAFSVAAHLEPEILLVDEVLAVGDAEFQKKCIGKMKDVVEEGRTVLFVSHNLGAIETLCEKSIVLNKGKMTFYGEVKEGLEEYLNGINENLNNLNDLKNRTDRNGNGKAKAKAIRIYNDRDIETNRIFMGDSFSVEVDITGKLDNAIIGILIGNMFNKQLIRGYTWENTSEKICLSGNTKVKCEFQNFPLMHGEYDISIWIGQYHDLADYIEDVASLTIEPKDLFNCGRNPDPRVTCFCDLKWHVE